MATVHLHLSLSHSHEQFTFMSLSLFLFTISTLSLLPPHLTRRHPHLLNSLLRGIHLPALPRLLSLFIHQPFISRRPLATSLSPSASLPVYVAHLRYNLHPHFAFESLYSVGDIIALSDYRIGGKEDALYALVPHILYIYIFFFLPTSRICNTDVWFHHC